jgi:hypothetical protein
MGAFVADGYVPLVQAQVNIRFSPGDALTEMIAFQKEFSLFSSKHTLMSSFSLLNIAPLGDTEREGFYRYVERLNRVGATVNDQPSTLSGHDQIVASVQKNLLATSPKPVFFTYHPGGGKEGVVRVSTSTPLSFSPKEYLTISVPTLPKKGKGSSSKG